MSLRALATAAPYDAGALSRICGTRLIRGVAPAIAHMSRPEPILLTAGRLAPRPGDGWHGACEHARPIQAAATLRCDWEEIRELVTEGYRILAPKKLTALLD
jgi:hypothetical protein